MREVSFGIGGFDGHERKLLATVTSSNEKINTLAKALREVGFWTRVDHISKVEPTIEVGEVIIQKV